MPTVRSNSLLVEMIQVDLLLPMARSQQIQKVLEKLAAIVCNEFVGIFAYNLHLPNMGFGLNVA